MSHKAVPYFTQLLTYLWQCAMTEKMTVEHGAINNHYDQAVMACDILSD